MEIEKLNYLFEDFPLDEKEMEETQQFGKYWIKNERDRTRYFLFAKNPDYVNKELFFKIMNGY